MSLANSEFDDAGFDDGLELDSAEESTISETVAQSEPEYRQQGFSIYTVMLILAFVFLVTAMILFFMEVGRLKA